MTKPQKTARTKKALFCASAIGVLAGAAAAQVAQPDAPLKLRTDYFGYSASASARASYTDNIGLARDGLKDSEYALSTLFSGGAIVSTPRVTALILGDLDFSYLIDQGDFVVNQNIGATSTFTAVDDYLYLDLSGSTSRQLVGDNARYSGNLNAARNQRANVHSYSASPFIFHRFADQSSTELRYRFAQSFVDGSSSPIAFLTGSTLNDSITHEVFANYDSGRALDRIRLRLSAYGSDTTESGESGFPDFTYRQGSLTSDIQIALTSHFALSGAVGYDDVETGGAASLFFDDDVLSGFFWRAGFTAKPGPRSNVRLEYGQRYGDDFIDANASYRVSDRFTFSAGASRSFRTRAQSLSDQNRATQRATLDFADRLREGSELSARNLIEAANWYSQGLNFGRSQTTGVSISDSAHASLGGNFQRLRVSLNGYYNDDDFGFRTITSYGAGLNVQREVSRHINAYGSVSWRNSDTTVNTAECIMNPVIFGFDVNDPLFDAPTACAELDAQNGVTDTVVGRLGGSYQLYENASVFVEVGHTERYSENALLEYSENNIIAGVTLGF
ncbi:MAG: hypothetical protein R3C58_06725 [Parvularculaceae bacterium]